jgi:DNA-binding transcriptional MerR regulator
MAKEIEMNLAALAERSRVPGRTIRLYIAEGLLPGPLRAGRNAAYDARHLAALERIKALQRRGLTLSQVRHALADADSPPELPEPEAWRHYVLAPDVEVRVKAGGSPWRAKLIREAIAELNMRLQCASNEESNDAGQ